MSTLNDDRTRARRWSIRGRMLQPPTLGQSQGGARTPALVRSLTNKTARVALATDGGQICRAQPGGWAQDARWARSRAAGHRVSWTHQRPTIYLEKQLAGRETAAPQISLNRMSDLRLRRGWTGHRPSTNRSKRAEEEKTWGEGNNKKFLLCAAAECRGSLRVTAVFKCA